MKILFTFIISCLFLSVQAQSIKGILKDDQGAAVLYANVALYNSIDSTMVKVETSNETGAFHIKNLKEGNYFLKSTYVGLADLVQRNLELKGDDIDLGVLTFKSQSIGLEEITVSAERVMVEVKADRTVFNVQGTINSTGTDVIELLRKAPAVTIDNNDNITVLGRSGVRVYIDGKVLPLTGDDLSAYLKNLSADQIDRIEIISNPGAKYEAEGNAGIIDIRLKKDKNLGTNGSLSTTFTKGQLFRYNTNGTANYRNKKYNLFGNAGYNSNNNFSNTVFRSFQNGLLLDRSNDMNFDRDIYSYRLGTDFFLNKNHTVGFLLSGRIVDAVEKSANRTAISEVKNINLVDSILLANNRGDSRRNQNTYNLNYSFSNKTGQSINIDLDYGSYKNQNKRYQPNIYYDETQQNILTEVINEFDTPNNIDIYTAKIDYEQDLGKGKLGLGSKYSFVNTNNTFKFFDVIEGISTLNTTQSNLFDYKEKVSAAYLTYAQSLGKKWNFSAGLRVEHTNIVGDLTTFESGLEEDPVKLDYLNWFPSLGLTWKIAKAQSLALNYGRRINRPNYSVLNPFRTQISELSIRTGNPFLKPEIVNNIELGYTVAYKYNFKVAYSRTTNKITRLIGPDESDVRANFISWDNLATQKVLSFSASLPFEISKWWDVYMNLSSSYIDNQADYGEGQGTVDVQAFTYSIYQQHTFKLIKGFKGEISGYYSGPGVWGGVFKYDANWSLGMGLQKKFLDDKLKVRVSASNIFNRFGWRGGSEFNGLISTGQGSWDNSFVSLNLNYRFGNQNVKSRRRKTGIENESKRVN